MVNKMSEKIILDDFYPSGNVKPVKEANDINKEQDHYVYVGTNWCAHSQLGTAHFSEACGVEDKDGKNRLCYGLDLGKKGAREIAKELNLPEFKGVPAMVKWNSADQKYEKISVGRRMANQVLDIFKKNEGGL